MKQYLSWIDRAKSSFEIARTRNSNLICYEDLCYQAQQAVEKAIKGMLIYYSVEPQFTCVYTLLPLPPQKKPP